jgi:hypothetical protein
MTGAVERSSTGPYLTLNVAGAHESLGSVPFSSLINKIKFAQ